MIDQIGKTSPINFAWIEILPMMIVLVIVAFLIGFFPTLDYIPFGRDKIDIENVLNKVPGTRSVYSERVVGGRYSQPP